MKKMNSKLSLLFICIYYITSVYSACEKDPTSTIETGNTHDAIKLYSSDDGVTWESHVINSTSPGTPLDRLYSITSAGEGTYFNSGGGTWGIIMKSTDLGNIWINSNSAPGEFRSVYSLSSSNIIAVGDWYISLTTNAGTNWSNKVFSQNLNLNSVNFLNASTGVAVGNIGRMMLTVDGGFNWSYLPSITYSDLNDVYFSNQTGIAVGTFGRIFRTADGGINWTELESPTQQPLRGVVLFGESTGIAVGGAGTILRTTDSGLSWNSLSFTDATFYDVGENFHRELIAVGSDGTIISSPDGGESWIVRTSGTNRTLYGIFYRDLECYVVGE
jgi:photosystem II stability/assembly factor-like uncharacterized protein